MSAHYARVRRHLKSEKNIRMLLVASIWKLILRCPMQKECISLYS